MTIVSKSTDITKVDFKEGAIILIDKPLEWTSFDVVNKIRYRLRKKYDLKKFKVGHNGTLDPLATGLLMIFTGKYTKRIPEMELFDKRYTGTIKIGASTPSFDRETEEENLTDISHVNEELIIETAKSFHGEQVQEIPIYSATKINGTSMYKLARKGIEFKIKKKNVTFRSVKIIDHKKPFVNFDVLASKGTYIRTFARDFGLKMNASAYLYSLRRENIENFSVKDALDVEEFCNKIEL